MSLPHIGVGSFNRHMARPAQWLKRYGLFFEKFDIIDLENCLHHQRSSGYGKADTISDCDWLIERGFLFQSYMSKDGPNVRSEKVSELDRLVQTLSREGIRLEAEWRSHLRTEAGFQPAPPEAFPLSQAMTNLGWEISVLIARRQALAWRESGRALATNLEEDPSGPAFGIDEKISGQQLLHVVLDQVPVPSRRTPWSEIVAFRADPDSQERLRALRAWISSTARSDVSYAEAADILADVLSRYRAHIRQLGLDYEISQCRALVQAGGASYDQLRRDWLSRDSAKPFGLSWTASTLLPAERGAPGREVSYIVKIQDAAL
ncbi:hypothetical protein JQ543_23595 [Bradyrhizobium diazoefficiens]|nr:hypothetical protein [Bradyrhizobium diazoefficiens]MBR0850746.1 hypothetical protein [Bradyrhizobium diazoefficiens]